MNQGPWFTTCQNLCDLESHLTTIGLTQSENNNSSVTHLNIRKIILQLFKNVRKRCLEDQPKLDTNRKIKDNFGVEDYLHRIKRFAARSTIYKLRTSSHNLNMERGKYNNTPREERFCLICKNDRDEEWLDDEEHFYVTAGSTMTLETR